MQKDVRQPVVGNNEAVALGNVEPLDTAGEFDEASGFGTILLPVERSLDKSVTRSGGMSPIVTVPPKSLRRGEWIGASSESEFN